MHDAQSIKAQLKAAGAGWLLASMADADLIAATLRDDERVELVTNGKYTGKAVVIIGTHARLLLFGLSPKEVSADLAYRDMASVAIKPGFSTGTITLTTTQGPIVLQDVTDRASAEALHTYLQQRTTAGLDVPQDTAIRCPKCQSDQITADKKGFGLGKAAVGGVLLGPVGLLGGFIGSGKVKVTCIRCGHSWQAGKGG